jgi:broad specificity phosphatase PhoE
VTTIVFVRHAATSWTGVRYCGRSDPPLSEDGVHAAEGLAIRLAPSLPGGVRIVTSPSRRARETATILARRAAPAVLETDPRWLEADVGDCEGLTFDEVEAASPGFAARLAAGEADIDWPGGETASALLARVTAAWESILDTGQPTVVVSHSGPIRLAIALATGRSVAEVAFPGPAASVTVEVPTDARATDAARGGS